MRQQERSNERRLLRIHLGESDRWQHRPLVEFLIETARDAEVSGCTVLRGISGFGVHRAFRSDSLNESAMDLPITLELVDERQRLQGFLHAAGAALHKTLITEERAYEPADVRAGRHRLLRFFLAESDRAGQRTLYWEILERAREMGIAGATAFRGMAGFGASHRIHRDRSIRVSGELPVIVEIIDSKDRIEAFLKAIAPLLQGVLVTEESVAVYSGVRAA